ncbi:hypothetical protein BU25DRAFT_420431 [Macroventuria anomochaeta]|uniref:Uncharacterized protein n=1 Tax=Macroventuria anomochaeta TaxID=301207 RepID=A0ACB6S4X1_9PLEO|nr:uncharacterized protein BU25DRAFT_420431 [Macroventuria anomochaeta]KAF2629008.1 hypothetical protein BU25DRAFT_420431 [Macroventuria anomochaeta]
MDAVTILYNLARRRLADHALRLFLPYQGTNIEHCITLPYLASEPIQCLQVCRRKRPFYAAAGSVIASQPWLPRLQQVQEHQSQCHSHYGSCNATFFGTVFNIFRLPIPSYTQPWLKRPERFEQDGIGSGPQSPTTALPSDFEQSDSSSSDIFICSPPEPYLSTILRTCTTLLDSPPPCRKRQKQTSRDNMGYLDMPPEWAKIHAEGARTTSTTLQAAAFPSLSLDQPRQPAAAQAPCVASNIVDLTEPEEEEDDLEWIPSTSTHIDAPNVLSEDSRKAIEYHVGHYTPEDGPTGDAVRAERSRMIKAGVLPKPKHPRKPSKTNPDYEYYILLQIRVRELLEKKRELEVKLRFSRDTDHALRTALKASSTKPLSTLPATKESIQLLKKEIMLLTQRIWSDKHQDEHAAKARQDFLTKHPKLKEPETKYAFRRGAEDAFLPTFGHHDDLDWKAMQAIAKKTQTQTEGRRPYSVAEWPRLDRKEVLPGPVVDMEGTDFYTEITDNLRYLGGCVKPESRLQ